MLAVLIKVIISATVPASFDLAQIVSLSLSTQPPIPPGPWTFLNSKILGLMPLVAPTEPVPGSWWESLPSALPVELRLMILLVRLPSLMFDLAIGIALYFAAAQINSSREVARLTWLVWILNPYATFIIEMITTPDVAVAFLTLAAVILLSKQKFVYASVALAGGIALKLYPILLVPPVLVFLGNGKTKAKMLIAVSASMGVAGYFAWVSKGSEILYNLFVTYTSVTQPLGMFFANTPEIPINLLTVVMVMCYVGLWAMAKKLRLLDMVMVVLLLYYVFADPFPQYFVWALPFLTLNLVASRRSYRFLFTVMLCLAFLWGLMVFNGYLTPSGYSLLLIPLKGSGIPWYSQTLVTWLYSPTTVVILLPVVKAALSAAMFILALDVVRERFLTTALARSSRSE